MSVFILKKISITADDVTSLVLEPIFIYTNAY